MLNLEMRKDNKRERGSLEWTPWSLVITKTSHKHYDPVLDDKSHSAEEQHKLLLQYRLVFFGQPLKLVDL